MFKHLIKGSKLSRLFEELAKRGHVCEITHVTNCYDGRSWATVLIDGRQGRVMLDDHKPVALAYAGRRIKLKGRKPCEAADDIEQAI